MEPVVTPLMAEECLGLRNFVRMMRERIINTATVNIKIFSLDEIRYTADVLLGTILGNTLTSISPGQSSALRLKSDFSISVTLK